MACVNESVVGLMDQGCGGCSLDLWEFTSLVQSWPLLFEFLVDHGVLLSEMRCGQCGAVLELAEDSEFFRCQRLTVTRFNKKVKRVRCRFKRSFKHGTWFSGSCLSISNICRITYLFLAMRRPGSHFIRSHCHVSQQTVQDWSHFCREVMLSWYVGESVGKIGGAGSIVELYGANVGKPKYKSRRGRSDEELWVFGGIERNTNRIFVIPVEVLTSKSLMCMIEEFIMPGTTLMSDCWQTFDCLSDHDFERFHVNLSMNFIGLDSGANTARIERLWCDIRNNIPRCGLRTPQFVGYLAEFMFRRRFPDERERMHHFLLAVKKAYPLPK
ncbi:uncharacterized protein LOC134530721 isoform X1 [Bacillus rossius redtenbacheri]|uniref:uncharacterized protein LOC134530721 isoform X1 n=1 Tax=Bacillus rossius redtenbacheri TaxID=93214 RepID=UPI002FDE7B95